MNIAPLVLLWTSPDHALDAVAIHERCLKTDPTVTLAAVAAQLNDCADRGEVIRIVPEQGATMYRRVRQ